MLSVYRLMVQYRRDERARAERGLSPRALSRLTRTVDDERAWDDAYRSAVRIGAARADDAWCDACKARGAHRVSCPTLRAVFNARGPRIVQGRAYPSAVSVMEREG